MIALNAITWLVPRPTLLGVTGHLPVPWAFHFNASMNNRPLMHCIMPRTSSPLPVGVYLGSSLPSVHAAFLPILSIVGYGAPLGMSGGSICSL